MISALGRPSGKPGLDRRGQAHDSGLSPGSVAVFVSSLFPSLFVSYTCVSSQHSPALSRSQVWFQFFSRQRAIIARGDRASSHLCWGASASTDSSPAETCQGTIQLSQLSKNGLTHLKTDEESNPVLLLSRKPCSHYTTRLHPSHRPIRNDR